MKTILKSITNGISNGLHHVARARVRTELLAQSDRVLADAGFCRELLESGVNAWPWRRDVNLEDASYVSSVLGRQRKAIHELQALDDAALADLAVTRGDIPRAVREGRIGIETDRNVVVSRGGVERNDRIAA